MLEVLAPGLLSTVQDAGRPGLAHLGVPPSGAADPWSLAVANRLLGNAPDAPALEITLAGLELAVRRSCVVALAGADLMAHVPEEARDVSPGVATLLRAGTTLAFRGPLERRRDAGPSFPPSGARAVLALAGGLLVPVVLGSASTSLAGGFGGIDGRALRPGDRLTPARPEDTAAAGRLWPADRSAPVRWPGSPVRVVAGPHADRPRDVLERLTAVDWTVEPESDRMGVRLDGPALPSPARLGELVSFPVVRGAVQVPASGRPIVLLADHQTVGGYPVVAVAIRADQPLLGQLRPRDRVRFEVVTLDAARAAHAKQAAWLAATNPLEPAPTDW